MPTLHPGRFTTRIEGPFVVFLIGFRVNRLFAINKWLPTAKAMGPMLAELYAKFKPYAERRGLFSPNEVEGAPETPAQHSMFDESSADKPGK